MYGRQPMGQQMPFQQDQYQPMAPNVPGVLAQMPYQTAHNWRLMTRSRDIDAAVDPPRAETAIQTKSKVFQGQDGEWYYASPNGMSKTTVIHNPETGKPFYWDNEARDFLAAE